MAFTGQGSLDEIDEDKEDPWAKSQFPEEEAATKALDGVRLTPTPGESPTASPATPAEQEPVSRTSFTDVRRLEAALSDALDPSNSSFDAELRRAWLRLDKQTRREIHDHCR